MNNRRKKMLAQMDAINTLKLAVEHKDMVIANAFEWSD
jgi:hypothetical protein